MADFVGAASRSWPIQRATYCLRMDSVTDTAPSRRAFVLHEHQRPRHHFDLRLEEDGILRSWALLAGYRWARMRIASRSKSRITNLIT